MVIYLIHTHAHRCLKELLDFDASITKADKDGNNALHIACIHGQLHIVQFLLQRGLSAEMRCVYTCNIASYWLTMVTTITTRLLKTIYYPSFYSNGYLGTPLACAAYYGHDHIVKYLFSHDVYCNGSYAELQVLTWPMHKIQ